MGLTIKSFTPEQLANWRLYEDVRKAGKWNMLDPRAQRATGLDRDEYLLVMEYYGELKAAYEAAQGQGDKHE